MTSDDRFATTQTPTGAMPGRSPEYDDGQTGLDTSRGTRGGDLSDSATTTRDRSDNRDGLGRDRTADVTADESGTLIAADKVIGTAVYDAAGERLGTIDSIMLNKRSGQVAYAVMSFGGFLGIGERYHPLPWHVLSYDQDKGGYNVQHSADDLRRAPSYSRDEVSDFDYGTRTSEIDSYYGAEPIGGAALAGAATDRGEALTPTAADIAAADAIGSTTGAGSSGMGSTGMGSNRNF